MCVLLFPMPISGNSFQRHTLSLHSDTSIINRLWIWVSMPGSQSPHHHIRCSSIFKITESWLALWQRKARLLKWWTTWQPLSTIRLFPTHSKNTLFGITPTCCWLINWLWTSFISASFCINSLRKDICGCCVTFIVRRHLIKATTFFSFICQYDIVGMCFTHRIECQSGNLFETVSQKDYLLLKINRHSWYSHWRIYLTKPLSTVLTHHQHVLPHKYFLTSGLHWIAAARKLWLLRRVLPRETKALAWHLIKVSIKSRSFNNVLLA